jgi:hypothetical protein
MRKSCYLGILLFFIVGALLNCGEDNQNPAEVELNPEAEQPVNGATVDLREYIPLKVGNWWTYQRTNNGVAFGEYTLFIRQMVDVNGKNHYQIDYEEKGCIPYDAHRWAIEGEGNELLESGFVYLDQKMIVGKERITIPAGTFNCIKVKRDVPGIEPIYIEPVYEWYGKGIGLVKIDHSEGTITIDSPEPIKGHLVDVLKAYSTN